MTVFGPAASIYEFPFPEGTAFTWTCLLCASGTGQAPTHQQADNDAHIHWRANHNHQETRA